MLAARPTPTRIGRYEVEKFVGQGGMGVVYKARDPHIDRTVAIKVMDAVDATKRSRFLREMRLLGTLKHPNIVTVFDCGEHEQQPYLVMEYVEGMTLVAYIRGVRSPITHRLQLLGQLCAALEYAHARHIVHRDIKPANLMLDQDGALKVLDFGIARSDTQQVTETGRIVGTLKYMSPEQLDGQPVDHRADIFAVGLLMYEMLSSHSAFPDGTAGRVMHAVMHEQPAPLAEICPGLDPELDRIVSTAIQKDPARRYQDVATLAADVARVSVHIEPPVSTEEWTPGVTPPPSVAPVIPASAETRRLTRWRGSWTTSDARHYIMAIAGLVLLGSALLVPRLLSPRDGSGAKDQPAVATSDAGQAAKPGREAGASAPQASSAPAPPPADSTGRGSFAPAPSTTPESPTTSIAAAPSTKPASPAVSVELPVLPAPSSQPALDLLAEARVSFPTNPPPWWAGRPLQFYSGSFPGPGSVPPPAQAFERECDAGVGKACFDLATWRRVGQRSPQGLTATATLFRRACDAGFAAGCSDLGSSYKIGSGVPRDESAAISFYERACAAGSAVGCANLGASFVEGVTVTRDLPQAAKLFQRACDARDGDGCYALGYAYAFGRGVAANDDRARDAFARACDAASAAGCQELALKYRQTSRLGERETRLVAPLEQRAVLLQTNPSSPMIRPIRITVGTPVKTKDAAPAYPVEARAANLNGIVTVELTIGVLGSVIDAKVLRSIPGLDAAAVDAVKRWEYAPTVIDGIACQIILTVDVRFPPS